MLTHIHIENFTIVDTLSLDFDNGFSVLTGETGAGKSIIVDAVMLALGGRADSGVIRQGQTRCDISLSFALDSIPEAKQWLQDQQLDSDENECIIRRTINADGKSRNTINAQPCPQQQVRELSHWLISIHGQHQHQALLKADTQLHQLDHYANNETILAETKRLYRDYHEIEQRLESLKNHSKNSEAQLSLLDYQLRELNLLAPQPGEWQELFQTHKQMHHHKKIVEHLNLALAMGTEQDHSLTNLLQTCLHEVQEVASIDPKLNSTRELLQAAQIHVEEAMNEINHYLTAMDLNSESLASIEDRISSYHELSRKHRVDPEELHAVQEKLTQEMDELNNAEAHIANLQKELKKILDQYNEWAVQLTQRRHKAGEKLSKAITKSMQELGMEGGQFKVEFESISHPISALGNEKVLFIVSTNPGQPFQPMHKVISGGELSRISLALQVITAEKENTPTLIFDEVDVGIGGKTAAIVGELLNQLGKQVQVLCITHLPQVAAKGHHHYKVSKKTSAKQTVSQIDYLDKKPRQEEIARMLGGATITEQSLAHAAELLS